ncbi:MULTISPECIES: CBS domain-containing protein [Rufibacter]|uniref:Putative transcriptional regulator n=1 Tax=Rufibacter quisquiliarum TaxID=1549639 RepID=A0A839GQC2_9BACT|nr:MULTISPECIES: CBS domain-containing protein [Rufibacter]MBA9077715.1 putative transcriptional regulator [Rufibacter quisquiliarum]
MIAEELINQMVPPLKLSDSGEKAVRWMEEFRLNQLPVVKNRKYLGLVTEENVLEAKDMDLVLENIPFDFEHVHVQQNQHFYNVMEVAIKNKIQVVPVLDDLQEYLGVITVNDTIAAFGQMSAMQGQGGILVLCMAERDYSLSEISRLVESNNAKILSAYVSPDEADIFKMKLTLKINTVDLTRIVATLERFGYKITAQFQDGAETQDDNDRLDLLMRYLNI